MTAEDNNTKINLFPNIPCTFLLLKASAFLQIFFPGNLYSFPTSFENVNFLNSKGLSTNNFCHAQQILSIKQKTLHPPVLNGQYQHKWNTNQNQMKNTTPFKIVFQVYYKVLLCKISHQIFYFLLLYISFYISRHHFSQICRTSFNFMWKKIFIPNFPFLMDSLKPPQWPKSVKCDKSFLLIFPKRLKTSNKRTYIPLFINQFVSLIELKM